MIHSVDYIIGNITIRIKKIKITGRWQKGTNELQSQKTNLQRIKTNLLHNIPFVGVLCNKLVLILCEHNIVARKMYNIKSIRRNLDAEFVFLFSSLHLCCSRK
jgi:hypothetical protein